LTAELAFFVAEITHPLLNLALSKQKLLAVRFIGLAAAGAAKSGAQAVISLNQRGCGYDKL
jgi:hypothetical protein